ncbi:MAG TPA: SulP family inorganic anion transporter [Rickettsiales bacterium]|nr:SulP family inorganic anion transporter [Rickettsiales bacterium]
MFPLACALRKSLREGYSLNTFRHDLIAALIVSLVALPLDMALAIAVGLPPQYGLYTAIVTGIIVPLLGGAPFQVSGPTAAFVVILAPIVSQHGLHGLIITTIISGILLILMGITKVGRYINYVPYPVTTGFTSGIAMVIATISLNDLLGLRIENLHGSYIEKVSVIASHMPSLYWPEALVGLVSLFIMFTSRFALPKVPPPVVGIAIGTLLTWVLNSHGFDIATLGSRFTFQWPDGSTGHGIPPFAPSFHWPNHIPGDLFAWPSYEELKILAVPSLVIATLGALESLLSATVADGIAGTRHAPNAELIAVGIGNVLSGLASGIPATGAIARTATNIHSGAKTPLASAMHALFIMIYVMLLARYMSYIPMSALAALLVTVAYRMSHYRQFVRTLRIAPGSDSLVLLVCFGFTVFIDMVAGVTAGVVLACLLLLKRLAALTSSGISTPPPHLNLPSNVLIYHINGALFFATAEKAFDRAGFMLDNVRTLIIDMLNVPLIDMTGLVAMKTMILDIAGRTERIILCGKPEITGKIIQKLPPELTKVSVADTLENAAMAALHGNSGRD